NELAADDVQPFEFTWMIRAFGVPGDSSEPSAVLNYCECVGFGCEPNNTCQTTEFIDDSLIPFSTLQTTTAGFPDESCVHTGDDQIRYDLWYATFAPCTGTVTVSIIDADYDAKVGLSILCAGDGLA